MFAVLLGINKPTSGTTRCHKQSACVCAKSLSRVQFFTTPWTIAYQAPPSMGFSRQEYWSGLPFPSPGDLSRPRDRTRVSHIVGRCSTVWATREVHKRVKHLLYDNLIKALSNRSTDRDFSPCTTISNTNTYNMDKETNAVNNSIPYGDTWRLCECCMGQVLG